MMGKISLTCLLNQFQPCVEVERDILYTKKKILMKNRQIPTTTTKTNSSEAVLNHMQNIRAKKK